MKLLSQTKKIIVLFIVTVFVTSIPVLAQDEETKEPEKVKKEYVRNTFGSIMMLDNQTVEVPIKGTFEMDIQHRFGVLTNGKKDFFGLFAPSNIRIGFDYVPINKLLVGFGYTKDRMQLDLNAKYLILKQTKDNSTPVGLTYFANAVIDTRGKEIFAKSSHRMSYFHQLIIARKLSKKTSLQLAPSASYYNNVEGYVNTTGDVSEKMKNLHFALATLGKVKVSNTMYIIAGWDQPLTKHKTNNPKPNVSLGIEVSSSAHSFQVFLGNYYGIVPQSNNFYNKNDFTEGQYMIGFNITRLWNW